MGLGGLLPLFAPDVSHTKGGTVAFGFRFYERNGYRASGKVGDHFGMPLYEYVKAI